MDAPRAAVRLGVFASVAVLVGLVAVSLTDDRQHPVALAVLDREGTGPMPVPTEAGYYVGTWRDSAVAIVVA
ncbi:MAG TPA: hypothetical protein VJ874_06035, partial [Candidatus Thermoplasmatota archaeon]|nr:hypothetical protein [Candidatus Thermoplasmatota archaeon]